MKKVLYTLFAFSIFLSACQKVEDTLVSSPASSTFNHRIPLTWNQLYLELERFTPGYRPPVAARNHAYLNLMAYEAAVHGSNGRHNSFSGVFPGLRLDPPTPNQAYNWEVCVNAAYEKGFELFFPIAPAEQQFQILDVAQALRGNLQAVIDPETYRRSTEYGRYLAETIYDWSTLDEWGHEAYLKNEDPDFTPTTGLGTWHPTFPDFAPALLPHWGKVRTFAALESDVSKSPLPFSTESTSLLYGEALEVKSLVDEIKAGNREDEKWIAEFWSDDCPILTFTPSGRWVSIANQLVGIERMNMMETLELYAKLGMALSDAGVKCWADKYKFNCLRPIDYIRAHLNDPDWNTVMCPDGSGAYFTPNFPAFPSGHATFGAAAAIIFETTFGQSYRFTDRSHEGRAEFDGRPRTFSSFRAMAIENAESRIPLGVHFRSDADAGLDLGFTVGFRVVTLPWR